MRTARSLVLFIVLGALLAPAARAEMALIRLEHYWVMDIGGQRFGLIEFDTPSTMILAGAWQFDVPVPAYALAAPIVAVPLLFAVAFAIQARRRRWGHAV